LRLSWQQLFRQLIHPQCRHQLPCRQNLSQLIGVDVRHLLQLLEQPHRNKPIRPLLLCRQQLQQEGIRLQNAKMLVFTRCHQFRSISANQLRPGANIITLLTSRILGLYRKVRRRPRASARELPMRDPENIRATSITSALRRPLILSQTIVLEKGSLNVTTPTQPCSPPTHSHPPSQTFLTLSLPFPLVMIDVSFFAFYMDSKTTLYIVECATYVIIACTGSLYNVALLSSFNPFY
jgi:hypothetical protein